MKHYEDNLAELKANLDGHEKARNAHNKVKAKEYLKKAKAHLDRVKSPSKHVPLDPDNLPFRARKAKKAKAPRLKKAEFEKDFGPQKKKKRPGVRSADFGVRNGLTANNELRATSNELHAITTAANPRFEHSGTGLCEFTPLEKDSALTGWARIALKSTSPITYHSSPILIASTGSLAGLLSSDTQLPSTTDLMGDFDLAPFAINDFTHHSLPITPHSSPLQIAQAIIPPAPEDLIETPEVQFTPEIQALAAELNHNPVKIYEWVRNNIEFVPTYGSIQGAQMTMETKLGNAFDTASLLIALLRASGIPAKYVYGTVELPIAKAMNWVGGVTDPKMVGTIFATNGVPVKMLVSGGTYKAVQLEHVWVNAFVDYSPSRGAVHKQGDTWIPLDASFKQYTYTQGIDISAAVPFDAQSFADQLVATATTNTVEGYVTNVDSAYIQQTMQDYQTQVQNYMTQNNPNATVGDVIGKKEIIQQNYPILLGTLPYKTIQLGAEFAQIPGNYRATMTFSIPDQTELGAGLSYSTSLPEIVGKKITLSFAPATADDQKILGIYLEQATSSLPAYLINLKPELRVDGQVVASGVRNTMGSAISYTMSLNEPGIGMSKIDNIIKSGEYFGIGLDTGLNDTNYLSGLKSKLESTKGKLTAKIIWALQKMTLQVTWSTLQLLPILLNLTELIKSLRAIWISYNTEQRQLALLLLQ